MQETGKITNNTNANNVDMLGTSITPVESMNRFHEFDMHDDTITPVCLELCFDASISLKLALSPQPFFLSLQSFGFAS